MHNRGKKALAGAMLALLAIVLALQASPLLVQAQSYQTIKTITGSSDQTTDYFNVPTGEWRISWSYTPDPSYPSLAVFSIFAYPQGESNIYSASVMEIGDKNTTGLTYVHEQQGGDYYLKIVAANVATYTIIIEALSTSPSVPEYPSLIVMVSLLTVGAASIVLSKKRIMLHP
jgi:hypothetical protein